jgi:hypothetical protein
MSAHNECEILASQCLYLTQVPDKFHGIAPVQAPRQFAMQQALKECSHFVAKMLAHETRPHLQGFRIE